MSASQAPLVADAAPSSAISSSLLDAYQVCPSSFFLQIVEKKDQSKDLSPSTTCFFFSP
jgi:hypothetical protein